MTSRLKLATVAVFLTAMLAIPTGASATSTLTLYATGVVGGTPGSCVGSLCTFSGALGNFLLTIDTGNGLGYPPAITVTSAPDIATFVPSDLRVVFSANNLNATGSGSQTMSTTLFGSGSSDTFTTYLDTNNSLYTDTPSCGTCSALATQSFAGADPVFTSAGVTVPAGFIAAGGYSLTEVFTLHATVQNQSYGAVGSFAIPEPASLSLIGIGLLGCGFGLRKKLLTA